MNKLNALKTVISALNNHEEERIRHHIAQSPNPNPKEEFLFGYLVSNRNEEIEHMASQSTPKIFSALVSSLYDNVLDALSLNLYHEFPESYSEIGQALLTVRKNLIFIQYLVTKSHFKESILLLGVI